MKVKVLLLHRIGGGFADTVEVEEGTTIAALIADRLPDQAPASMQILVNRDVVPPSYVLKEGDRVTATPKNVAGARG